MFTEESQNIYTSKKILNIDAAKKEISKIKAEKKTVGLCHGGFDLLHPGHIKHFEYAKKICDCLFVSITSDKFVALLKGKGRPIFSDKLRAYFVASIKFVDYVVISDFKLGVEVISILKPSYYIKGPDYMKKSDPAINAERDTIISIGGKIKYTNEPKLSTTAIIKYIKENL